MGRESGVKFKGQRGCILNSVVTRRSREAWPDEKNDEQENKLQDKKVKRKRKDTKTKEGKGEC